MKKIIYYSLINIFLVIFSIITYANFIVPIKNTTNRYYINFYTINIEVSENIKNILILSEIYNLHLPKITLSLREELLLTNSVLKKLEQNQIYEIKIKQHNNIFNLYIDAEFKSKDKKSKEELDTFFDDTLEEIIKIKQIEYIKILQFYLITFRKYLNNNDKFSLKEKDKYLELSNIVLNENYKAFIINKNINQTEIATKNTKFDRINIYNTIFGSLLLGILLVVIFEIILSNNYLKFKRKKK